VRPDDLPGSVPPRCTIRSRSAWRIARVDGSAPGHNYGGPSSTLGEESAAILHLRFPSLGDFLKVDGRRPNRRALAAPGAAATLAAVLFRDRWREVLSSKNHGDRVKNWLKVRFIAGFFVTVPAFLTAWLLWNFWSRIDDVFAPDVPSEFSDAASPDSGS